jgi:hypothetical protein
MEPSYLEAAAKWVEKCKAQIDNHDHVLHFNTLSRCPDCGVKNPRFGLQQNDDVKTKNPSVQELRTQNALSSPVLATSPTYADEVIDLTTQATSPRSSSTTSAPLRLSSKTILQPPSQYVGSGSRQAIARVNANSSEPQLFANKSKIHKARKGLLSRGKKEDDEKSAIDELYPFIAKICTREQICSANEDIKFGEVEILRRDPESEPRRERY